MVMLTDLADVLRAAGLTVVEIDGWKTRARPASTGTFEPEGNLWHHTGDDADGAEYARWLATVGRSDLPPPLCQLSYGRDGTVYVCAAGRSNHAGKAKASGPMPAGDGNSIYLGHEVHNTGSEGFAPPQYASMVTAGAATSLAYGWTAEHNRAHKETSVTGKWDPGLLNMTDFREDVRAKMQEMRAAKIAAARAEADQRLREELTAAAQAAKHRPTLRERLQAIRNRIGVPKR